MKLGPMNHQTWESRAPVLAAAEARAGGTGEQTPVSVAAEALPVVETRRPIGNLLVVGPQGCCSKVRLRRYLRWSREPGERVIIWPDLHSTHPRMSEGRI